MKLIHYKFCFISIGLIGALLIASPALGAFFYHPDSEPFSEIYLLGPNKTAENIPFYVTEGENYTVYINVGNNLNVPSYYVCQIKMRNQTESYPDDSDQTSSTLECLYEYRIIIQNGASCIKPLTFSLSDFSVFNNASLLGSVTINDQKIAVNKTTIFDQDTKGYYLQVFIELWALNPDNCVLEYQNRYVYFWLNLKPS